MEINHPMTDSYLKRDILNIYKFFSTKTNLPIKCFNIDENDVENLFKIEFNDEKLNKMDMFIIIKI